MIDVRDLSKGFGTGPVLGPLSLRIEAGRTTAVAGPSGCGKSTLLRLLIGLLAPDAGSVAVASVRLAPSTVGALRRRMGYVIQEGGLFPHLTALGNVTLMARYLGWPAPRIAARVDELAALVRLAPDLLARYPAQLSGGQRQRVGIMRALMLDPDVLLLDEPLGALDPMIRSELQHDLRQLFLALGKTVVLVTHDMGEAAFLAHDIVLLRAGRIVQRGTLAELVDTPADPFVLEFINAQRSPLDALAPDATC